MNLFPNVNAKREMKGQHCTAWTPSTQGGLLNTLAKKLNIVLEAPLFRLILPCAALNASCRCCLSLACWFTANSMRDDPSSSSLRSLSSSLTSRPLPSSSLPVFQHLQLQHTEHFHFNTISAYLSYF